MKRIIESEARTQATLLPECLDDYLPHSTLDTIEEGLPSW